MGLLDYNEIPGYAEAVNAEQVNRDLAYLPESLPICGVPVRHMNARHWILLLGCRNRFLFGGIPQPDDVAMFLWFLSPQYSTNAAKRAEFIKGKVRKLNFPTACKGIYEYLERTFQDCPEGSGGAKQYTAPVASLVDLFGSEYGWTDEQVLEMPLARLFQQMRRIEMRLDPKHPQFNRSERFVSQWLAAQQQPQNARN